MSNNVDKILKPVKDYKLKIDNLDNKKTVFEYNNKRIKINKDSRYFKKTRNMLIRCVGDKKQHFDKKDKNKLL